MLKMQINWAWLIKINQFPKKNVIVIKYVRKKIKKKT